MSTKEASPNPGSIWLIGICRQCSDLIVMMKGGEWLHMANGKIDCTFRNHIIKGELVPIELLADEYGHLYPRRK